jgi:hypothetical protein
LGSSCLTCARHSAADHCKTQIRAQLAVTGVDLLSPLDLGQHHWGALG